MGNARKKVLAIASAGGHWIQLTRLMPAFEGHELCFVSTNAGYRGDVDGARFRTVADANRNTKLKMLLLLLQLMWIVLRFRPDVVVTTGAAPGYWACLLGRTLGARTLWIDSVANAAELSLSGRRAGKIVDGWFTQWEELARPDGPQFYGSVLWS